MLYAIRVDPAVEQTLDLCTVVIALSEEIVAPAILDH
jgi:hypothetical protein